MFICAVKLETLTCGMFYLLKVPAPKSSSFSIFFLKLVPIQN